MQAVEKSNRIDGLQYMRAVAAISVVVIHTLNSATIYFGDKHPISVSVVAESFKNCMWWGVPCFLMITGWLMLSPNKAITYKKIYSWYVPRMIAVLVLFGVPFAWLELIFNDRAISLTQLSTALYNVLEGKTWAHLWYIYALIGVYVLLPILRIITKNAEPKDLKYIVFVYIFFLMICPILNEVKLDFREVLRMGMATIYPCWMFLGYMFSRKMIVVKRGVAGFALCITCFLSFVITVFSMTRNIEMDVVFSYSSILVLFQSCAIFSLVSCLKLDCENPLRRVL